MITEVQSSNIILRHLKEEEGSAFMTRKKKVQLCKERQRVSTFGWHGR